MWPFPLGWGNSEYRTQLGLPSVFKAGPWHVDFLLHISVVMGFSKVFTKRLFELLWVGSSSGIHGVGSGLPSVSSHSSFVSVIQHFSPNPGALFHTGAVSFFLVAGRYLIKMVNARVLFAIHSSWSHQQPLCFHHLLCMLPQVLSSGTQ